jgi:hypothetical protein
VSRSSQVEARAPTDSPKWSAFSPAESSGSPGDQFRKPKGSVVTHRQPLSGSGEPEGWSPPSHGPASAPEPGRSYQYALESTSPKTKSFSA